MDDWTYRTPSDVDGVSPMQPALLEEDWRVAEERRFRAPQRAEVARWAAGEQAEAQTVRERESVAAPPLFGSAPASGFTL